MNTCDDKPNDYEHAVDPREKEISVLTYEVVHLAAALSDCVAFMEGRISGVEQKRGILAEAKKVLNRG